MLRKDMGEKSKLIIITRGYPLNDEELSFLVPELNVIKNNFDVVLLSKFYTRFDEYLSDEYKVIECNCKFSKFKLGIFALASFMDLRLWKETIRFIKKKAFNSLILKELLTDIIMSKNVDEKLKMIIKNCNNKKIIIYSYWYDYGVLSALKVANKNKNIKVITRAHGFDLYNERCSTGYQCFKEQIDKDIDKIVFISDYGKNYYYNTFGHSNNECKYCLGYLGTAKQSFIPYQKQVDMNILTCSSVIPLKRLDIVIDALEQISQFNIHWHHIGTGSNMKTIEELAEKKLGLKDNITYKFEGYLDIKLVMEYYRNHYIDCFILISDTEGLPFSIMEAMSFGIPVIANNVGGIKEIVNKKNGFLLESLPDATQLALSIENWYRMSDDNKEALRKEAYATWQNKFDSAYNAAEFMNVLDNL